MGLASSVAAAKVTSAQGHPQDVLRHTGRRPFTRGRDCRELLGVNSLDVSLETTGFDVQGLLRLELEVDSFVGRQSGDDVRQQASRNCDRTCRVDLARHPVSDPYLEVRGRELQAAVFGAKQNVVEDRQGAPGRDGAADDLEAAGQVLLHDR